MVVNISNSPNTRYGKGGEERRAEVQTRTRTKAVFISTVHKYCSLGLGFAFGMRESGTGFGMMPMLRSLAESGGTTVGSCGCCFYTWFGWLRYTSANLASPERFLCDSDGLPRTTSEIQLSFSERIVGPAKISINVAMACCQAALATAQLLRVAIAILGVCNKVSVYHGIALQKSYSLFPFSSQCSHAR